MVRKIKAKAILRLNDQGLSGRAIARSLGIARQSVAEVLAASAAAGIAYPDVETKPDDEVYSMLFPGRGERESVYEQPDWARVHRELARVGVTCASCTASTPTNAPPRAGLAWVTTVSASSTPLMWRGPV